jgi:hypothetical protein
MHIATDYELSKERHQLTERIAKEIVPKLLPYGTKIEKKIRWIYDGYAFYKENNDSNKKMKFNPLISLLRNDDKVAYLSEKPYFLYLRINAEVVDDTSHVDSGSYSDVRSHLLQEKANTLEGEIKKISKKNSRPLYISKHIGDRYLVLYIIDVIDPRLSETAQDVLLDYIYNRFGL